MLVPISSAPQCRVRFRNRLAILLLAAFVSASVRASSADNRGVDRVLSFSLVFGATYWIGQDISETLEMALAESGFDDTSPGGCGWFGCWDPTDHPYSDRSDDGAIQMAMDVRLYRGLGVRVIWTPGRQLGRTVGLARVNSGRGTQSYSIEIRPAVKAWSLLASLEVGRHAWIGAGLSRTCTSFEVSLYRTNNRQKTMQLEYSPLGLVLEAGLRLPLGRTFFVQGGSQYHWSGSIDLSPIDIIGSDGSIAVTLPATKLPIDWCLLGIGIGVRI